MLETNRTKVVHFIRNGDERNKCFSMLLNTRNSTNFNQLCQRISDRLKLEVTRTLIPLSQHVVD